MLKSQEKISNYTCFSQTQAILQLNTKIPHSFNRIYSAKAFYYLQSLSKFIFKEIYMQAIHCVISPLVLTD